MRVVVDATMLDGGPSGAATRLAGLGAAHRARGRVEVVHLVRPGVDPLPGLESVPFGGTTTPLSRGLAGRRLGRIVRRLGGVLFQAGALPLAAVARVPTVLTLHDLRFLDAVQDVSGWRALWARHRLQPNLRRAARIVTVSRSTADGLAARGLFAREHVSVVPNAGTPGLSRVDDPGQLASLRRAMDLNRRYVVALGPLSTHKRPELLLSALAVLHGLPGGGDVGLAFAGRSDPGAARALLRRAHELGLEHHVRLLGVVTDDVLAAVLSAADGLVLASRVEGFAIPVVDAQMLGVPVAAVDAGALRETCGEAAWFAASDDAPALARALLASITPGDEQQRRLARGRELGARWSWDASADRLEALWQQLAGDASRAEAD